MPTWLSLSLLAAVVWSIGQVAAKKGLTHISPLWSNILANFFTLLIYIPSALILGKFSFSIPSLPIVGIIALAGATYMIFFYAIEKGDISLTGSLSAIYPISTVVLAFIFLQERISWVQIGGIIIAITGVLLIALPINKFESALRKHKTWLIWGIVSALLSGSGDFLNKVAVNHVGPYTQMITIALLAQVLSIGNYAIDKEGRKLPKLSFHKFFPTILGTLFAVVGFVPFFLAFQAGPASLVVPASSIYPALVVLFAWIFLGERITKQQGLGIAGIIVGIMLLGFGGN